MRYALLVITLFMLVSTHHAVAASVTFPKDKRERIETEIQNNMLVHNIPGMAFALVDADGIVYANGFGLLNIRDDKHAIDVNTNFQIGSLSKVFVSLAIMKLQTEGAIHLDQPVADYLPWFSTQDEQLSKEITIRHLLSHTSGLPDRLNVHDIEDTDRRQIITKINEKLRDVQLVGKPGDVYEYTNMNTDLLQLVIEEVTRTSFTTYMEEHIFAPLQMGRTGYDVQGEQPFPHTATGHRYHWGKLKPYEEKLVYATAGSAGLSSNVVDLSKMIQMILNEGHFANRSFIPPDSLHEMFRPVREKMGYNWYVYPHNRYMEGGLPGFTSTMVLSADQTFGLVLLSNSRQDITLESGFNLYQIVEGRQPAPLLAMDYPKISEEARAMIILFLVICALTVSMIGCTVFELATSRSKLAFIRPDGKRGAFISLVIAAYGAAFYYLHIKLPYEIGVPTIMSFHKEPDLVNAILAFSIGYAIFSFVLVARVLWVRNTKRSSRSSTLPHA